MITALITLGVIFSTILINKLFGPIGLALTIFVILLVILTFVIPKILFVEFAGAGAGAGAGAAEGMFNRLDGLGGMFEDLLREVIAEGAGLGAGLDEGIDEDGVARIYLDIIPLQHFHAEPKHVNDVHDHSIQESIIKGIKNLQLWISNYPNPKDQATVVADIKAYIFGSEYGRDNYEKKEQAYNVLRHMTKSHGKLASVNLSEMEILTLVWNRITAPVNKEIQADLKSNLLESMAEASLTLDLPYCLTGRVSRIVQSLESIDVEGIVNVKSTENINSEMMSKIGTLRDRFFTEHPDLLEIYNKDDQHNSETAQVLMRLHDYIYAILRDEYLQTNIVTEKTFHKLLTPLLSSL